MAHITYQELEEFFGQETAYALLRVVEMSARMKNNVIHFDKNMRFRHAMEALSEERLAA